MKRNLIRILAAALALTCCLFTLTGCAEEQAEPVSLDNISELEDGYYVLKQSDETAYPLTQVSPMGDSAGFLQNTMQGTKTCFFVNEAEMDSVPVLEPGDLFIVKSQNALEDVITYFPLSDYGYTIGAILSRTSDPSLYGITSQSSFAEGSSAQSVFGDSIDSLEEVRISTIGDQPITEQLLSEFYTIKDLQRDSEYDIIFYEGTNTKGVTVTADTDLLVSDPTKIMRMSDKTIADQGFAILKFEPDTPEGYYYVSNLSSGGDNGGGIFKYEASGTDEDKSLESYEGITTEENTEEPEQEMPTYDNTKE